MHPLDEFAYDLLKRLPKPKGDWISNLDLQIVERMGDGYEVRWQSVLGAEELTVITSGRHKTFFDAVKALAKKQGVT